MKIRCIIALCLLMAPFISEAQELKKNEFTISIGPSHLSRQDLIFSPFVHQALSMTNLGLSYVRSATYYKKIKLGYSGFNSSLTQPYQYFIDDEPHTISPHYFTFIDADFLFGKKVKESGNSRLILGGLFTSDVQMLNYFYGRSGNFGYFSTFGIGVFSKYELDVNKKSKFSTSLQLPLISWVARSPYLVNDDEFIENISSHSTFKTFMAFMGSGKLSTLNQLQYFDFNVVYTYHLSSRISCRAAYIFEFIHASHPKNMLSYRNSLLMSGTYTF